MEDIRLYQIAFTLIKGIGSITGRQILQHISTPEAFFKEKTTVLSKIPGISNKVVQELSSPELLKRAEKELLFIDKNKIQLLFYTNDDYPQRLNECIDAPLLLYYKGETSFNVPQVLSVVGTRKPSAYGIDICRKLISELAALAPDTLICSGLAYGIDIISHREAIRSGLPTIGVLGHSLDRIYPASHRNTAIEMLEKGGLLTEFVSGTKPDRPNFVMRNRIIAGMADATLVVESAAKGGSLITATIANSYNRDVFAVPGRITDEQSSGCNTLIFRNQAALVQSASDIMDLMGWTLSASPSKTIQQNLFTGLTEEEQKIINCLSNQENVHINQIGIQCNIPICNLSSLLLNLEMQGIIRALPGCLYKMI